MPESQKSEDSEKSQKIETELEKRKISRKSGSESNAITKECIESALILLMREKPFSQITIQEIIRRAGVGRSSYYRNYATKDAILESRLDVLILEAVKLMGKYDFSSKSAEPWLAVLKMAKKHAVEFRLFLDAGFGDKILRKIINSCGNNPQNDETIRITDVYMAGCIYSVMTQWILDGMKTDENTVAEVCSGLMNGTVKINSCGRAL